MKLCIFYYLCCFDIVMTFDFWKIDMLKLWQIEHLRCVTMLDFCDILKSICDVCLFEIMTVRNTWRFGIMNICTFELLKFRNFELNRNANNICLCCSILCLHNLKLGTFEIMNIWQSWIVLCCMHQFWKCEISKFWNFRCWCLTVWSIWYCDIPNIYQMKFELLKLQQHPWTLYFLIAA